VQVALLGPLQVTVAGEAVAVGAAKERAVLAVLALRAGRGAGMEELTGAVWGDDPPRSAHKNVQKYVSALRRVLPDGVIETMPWGYQLRVAAEDVDVAVFERLVGAGRRASQEGDLQGEVSCLVKALGLWRGDPLLELADQPVGRSEATRLAELRRGARREIAIAEAMATGATWTQIASVLRVSAQAAHKRYRWLRHSPLTDETWLEPPLPGT
jgi:DNA-binding winged helix-turn-helix (wHTH) protein